VLIIRRSKLYYTASGSVTPVGGRPVHVLIEDSYYKTRICTLSWLITKIIFVGARSIMDSLGYLDIVTKRMF